MVQGSLEGTLCLISCGGPFDGRGETLTMIVTRDGFIDTSLNHSRESFESHYRTA